MGKLKKDRVILIGALAVIASAYLILINLPAQPATETVGEVTGAGVTDTGIQFTGNLIHEEPINEQANEHVFSLQLAERTRLAVQGAFQQPITLIVLSETYYQAWQRDREVKTNAAYLKDKESFYKRFDVNQGEGGTYYFIIQSQNGNINGEVSVTELAKL
jgi:hypothetical protein